MTGFQNEWLQQQKFISSEFWKLQVQDQGHHQALVSSEISLSSLQTTTFLLCPHMVFLPCVWREILGSLPLIRTPVPSD